MRIYGTHNYTALTQILYWNLLVFNKVPKNTFALAISDLRYTSCSPNDLWLHGWICMLIYQIEMPVAKDNVCRCCQNIMQSFGWFFSKWGFLTGELQSYVKLYILGVDEWNWCRWKAEGFPYRYVCYLRKSYRVKATDFDRASHIYATSTHQTVYHCLINLTLSQPIITLTYLCQASS